MIQTGHLETYDIILSVQTPVHIGSGITVNKQEYIYDPRSKTVRIIDIDQFLQMLAEKELAAEYENFIIRNTYSGGLKEFLESNSFTQSEIDKLVLYTCSVKGIFAEKDYSGASNGRVQKAPKNNIAQFIRMKNGRPYIPGSSVKGAIRTCLFITLCKQETNLGDFLTIKRNDRDHIDTFITAKGDREANVAVFNTLQLSKKTEDAVNSIMKTISVSDSEPIGNTCMTICNKIDFLPDGSISHPNVLRECVEPGTKIQLKLTIDRSLNGLTSDDIINAVSSFFRFYQSEYPSCFRLPANVFQPSGTDNLILGGGSGFFSKTVVYNLYEHDTAMEYVADWMEDKFPNGKHQYEYDFAPHTMKYTMYKGSYMPFGVCKFEVK